VRSKFGFRCRKCLSVAAEGSCQCGEVYSMPSSSIPNAILYYSENFDGADLVTAWFDDSGKLIQTIDYPHFAKEFIEEVPLEEVQYA